MDENIIDLDLLDNVPQDFTGCETDLEVPVGGSDEAAVRESQMYSMQMIIHYICLI